MKAGLKRLKDKTEGRFKRHRGFALIICVAVLAVLTMVLIAFTISTRFALQMAKNYTASTQAKYLAEAGIARAIAELKYGPNGAVNTQVGTTLDEWYGTDPYSQTNITLGSYTGTYTVTKIIDTASRININDGNPNLERMLKTLNSQLGSPLDDPADIDAIADNVPYETKGQILTVLSGTQAQRETKYNALKDYITVFSYIDPNTIDPQDISTPYALQNRAPINVNTASKEVLVAVLSGIEAINACSKCGGDGVIMKNQVCPACGGTGNLEIDDSKASDLADFIIDNRPYQTWSQVYASIQECPDIDEKDADLVMANANPNTGFSWARNLAWHEDLGDIGKYVIDFNKNGGIDSNDQGLTINTTEFSFSSGGYYQIETKGQVKNSLGSVVAERRLMAVVKIFDIYRETTQEQFGQGAKTDLQSYPEPIDGVQDPSPHSGQLALSVITHNQPSSGVHFRANYHTTLDADSSGGSSSLIEVAGKPTIGSVSDFSERGELMPDGMLVDYFDEVSPDYSPADNVDADEGTMIIWFKPRFPSYDPKVYGDVHINRKIIDLESAETILGQWSHVYPDDLVELSQYIEAFIYYNDALGSGVLCTAWHGVFWERFEEDKWATWGLYENMTPEWQKGEWLQLAWTWKNPDDIYDSSQYHNTSYNPMKGYLNGSLEREDKHAYHGPYDTPEEEIRAIYIGHDGAERSSVVIGSIRFYPDRLSDAEIQAEYLTGVYETSGSFTSGTFDVPGTDDVRWGTITWTEALGSSGGSLVFNVDTGSGFGGDYSDSSADNTILATTSSISYQIDFSSGTNLDTPVLEDVTITYLKPTEILYWSEVYE
jgi:hypothetical protein